MVVQSDVFNRSRIATTVVCLVTSNLARAKTPGNVLLKQGEGNVPKQSIISVSQVLTVNKAELVERIGRLPASTVDAVRDELKLLFDHL